MVKTQTITIQDVRHILEGLVSRNSIPLLSSEVLETLKNLEDTYAKFKRCTKCGKFYPATSEFFWDYDKSADGLMYQCKKCRKKARNTYNRKARVRNNYPAGDLEAINEFRTQNSQPPLDLPKRKPSAFSVQAMALQKLATPAEGETQ